MSNFVSLWSSLFQILADFLSAEPVIWFVGVFLLFAVVGLVHKLLTLNR